MNSRRQGVLRRTVRREVQRFYGKGDVVSAIAAHFAAAGMRSVDAVLDRAQCVNIDSELLAELEKAAGARFREDTRDLGRAFGRQLDLPPIFARDAGDGANGRPADFHDARECSKRLCECRSALGALGFTRMPHDQSCQSAVGR
jgi:hypothetical protein